MAVLTSGRPRSGEAVMYGVPAAVLEVVDGGFEAGGRGEAAEAFAGGGGDVAGVVVEGGE